METLQLTSATTIQLKNGDHTTTTKLEGYFKGLFQTQDTLSDFPAALDHVWRISYSRKSDAVAALKKNFVEGIDYQVLRQLPQNPLGGRPEDVYYLSVSCLEYFVVRQNREVFDVYRACLQLVRQLATKTMLPDFSNPAAAARAWADEVEAKALAQHRAEEATQKLIATSARVVEVQHELAVVKEEARENQVVVDTLTNSDDCLSFQDVAARLNNKELGRTKLMRQLRKDRILMQDNQPYASYLQAGYFKVVSQVYDTNSHGAKLTKTTKVTGKGLTWLAKKYGMTLPA
ncbi:phage antirepressor KilAC domain-containing protein [Hymenobacter terrenus]|uniref:phage antirepressor KilAC domain-containing protein n=1 Tax=Hymenobacter terrenus TaxID=1629124 RepID=UPI0006979A6B|nr:phage antirepressor KilAC domain-containing protein [Hymenobacter terrenus]